MKIKIWIDHDWICVVTQDQHYDRVIEAPEEKANEWKRIAADFNRMQNEIGEFLRNQPRIEQVVLRAGKIDMTEWADGDFIKTWPDGRTEPATYEEYCESRGMAPVPPNRKIKPDA